MMKGKPGGGANKAHGGHAKGKPAGAGKGGKSPSPRQLSPRDGGKGRSNVAPGGKAIG